MNKYRIVIRAFTNRRDVAPMELLKRLLERRGCEVMLANTRNFERILKYWKPHAIVVNTISSVMVKERYPNCKVIFFSGEGFHGPNDSHASIWKENPQYFDNMDVGLLWGDAIKKECDECFTNGKWGAKLHVVGNPKLDLVRFYPEELKKKKKNSIGIICRFPKLNDHLGRSTMHFLGTEFQLEETLVQARSATTTLNVIKEILEKTDFNVSIRPHPHEQIETYIDNVNHWFGKKYSSRVEIDDSLFIPKWIAEQRAIISPTSTSYLEAYLQKIPVINIDYLSDIVSFNKDYISFTKAWQESALLPKSTDELISLLHDEKALEVKSDPVIEEQLDKYCSGGDKNSACLNAAHIIVQFLNQTKPVEKKHLPYSIVDLMDEISFRRNMRRNKLHHNFCYRRNYHKIPEYVENIVDNIERNAIRADDIYK